MQSKAKTVDEYIASLPADRAEDVRKVRKLILSNLPDGYREGIGWGMIVYEIPLERHSDTYNGQPLGYVALAAQKHYLALYMMNMYGEEGGVEKFKDEYRKAGKKLDMGKSCIRFKKFEDLPAELIGRTVAMTPVEEWIEMYDVARARMRNE
jgi:hypothetical protein